MQTNGSKYGSDSGKWLASLLGAAITCTLVGCADLAPNWWHPGTAPYQRKEAQRFDPYPVPGIAPDVEGGRPPSFDKPLDEVRQAQTTQSYKERYGQPPAYSPGFGDPAGVPSIR